MTTTEYIGNLIDGRNLELINDGMAFLPREHAIMNHPMVAKMHRAMKIDKR